MSKENAPLRRHARGLATVGAALLATVFARDIAAQQLTGFPQADMPRYTVELIVFTYAPGATTSDEIFVPESPPFDEFMSTESAGQADSPVPVFSDGREPGEPVFGDRGLPPDTSEPSASQAPPAAEPVLPGDEASAVDDPANEITGIEHRLGDIPLRSRIELQLLSPEQYSMDRIYEQLVELDAYQPIMRAAWTQTTPPQDEAPAIRLRALGAPPPGLDGTVKLYQGRFVHLGVDLELDAEGIYAGGGAGSERRSATDRAIAGSTGADGRYGTLGDDPSRRIPVYSDSGYREEIYVEDRGFVPPPVRYRIDEVRIMRDGDLRYYDHPRFGVIAKLTKVPEKIPAVGD